MSNHERGHDYTSRTWRAIRWVTGVALAAGGLFTAAAGTVETINDASEKLSNRFAGSMTTAHTGHETEKMQHVASTASAWQKTEVISDNTTKPIGEKGPIDYSPLAWGGAIGFVVVGAAGAFIANGLREQSRRYAERIDALDGSRFWDGFRPDELDQTPAAETSVVRIGPGVAPTRTDASSPQRFAWSIPLTHISGLLPEVPPDTNGGTNDVFYSRAIPQGSTMVQVPVVPGRY